MDCYFHSNVPSVAACVDCRRPICATCRDERGSCPSCRLAAKVEAATATRVHLGGQIPPNPQPAVVRRAEVSVLDSAESRALVALGYPLWPLALLSLLDRKQSRYLRRQAWQALGFNVLMFGFGGLLSVIANLPIPLLPLSAAVLLPFLIPVFLVASVYYGIKTWNGDDVRVPIVGDWIEERLPLERNGHPETNAR
ncbi:MAG: DUF4870 domain-containing protein [Candidatus Eremiobacteraeota bacterium]|nr:DUF4870 domain-containing protein [Candidatus Eremiobacteraeota bacterium]